MVAIQCHATSVIRGLASLASGKSGRYRTDRGGHSVPRDQRDPWLGIARQRKEWQVRANALNRGVCGIPSTIQPLRTVPSPPWVPQRQRFEPRCLRHSVDHTATANRSIAPLGPPAPTLPGQLGWIVIRVHRPRTTPDDVGEPRAVPLCLASWAGSSFACIGRGQPRTTSVNRVPCRSAWPVPASGAGRAAGPAGHRRSRPSPPLPPDCRCCRRPVPAAPPAPPATADPARRRPYRRIAGAAGVGGWDFRQKVRHDHCCLWSAGDGAGRSWSALAVGISARKSDMTIAAYGLPVTGPVAAGRRWRLGQQLVGHWEGGRSTPPVPSSDGCRPTEPAAGNSSSVTGRAVEALRQYRHPTVAVPPNRRLATARSIRSGVRRRSAAYEQSGVDNR